MRKVFGESTGKRQKPNFLFLLQLFLVLRVSWSNSTSPWAVFLLIYQMGRITFILCRVFPVAQKVKNPPAVQETQVWSLGQEDPLQKEMATHSSTLAWRVPWMEEPGRLLFMGWQRVGQDLTTKQQQQRKIVTLELANGKIVKSGNLYNRIQVVLKLWVLRAALGARLGFNLDLILDPFSWIALRSHLSPLCLSFLIWKMGWVMVTSNPWAVVRLHGCA